MLQRGNHKLGQEIYSFSLPAKKTCPGRTKACQSVCYARGGHYHRSSVQQSLATMKRQSLQSTFADAMAEEIQHKRVKTVRIHASGDFYSVVYVNKWIDIARRCPGVTFYATTRSWVAPELYRALRRFAALPNVILWWSCDRDTNKMFGKPPAVAGVRANWLQLEEDEQVPRYVDLVYRVKRKTPTRRVDGVLVCAAETGMPYGVRPTCSRCRLCYVPKKQALEPHHECSRTASGKGYAV